MRLEPFLNVSNGPEAIAFYKSAFGANVLFLIPPETGSTIAQMEISGASFWLADESPEYQNPSPHTLQGSTVRLVLTVDDPDALFNRAVAPEPPSSGPSKTRTTAGASAESATPSATTGKSANHFSLTARGHPGDSEH